MPRQLAALIFGTGIFGLFVLDRDKETKTSLALWLPILWLSVGASRNISQWLNWDQFGNLSPDQYLDGSPLDGTILALLLVAGLAVLAMRARRSGSFMRENGPILLFFGYCLLSVVWSDYPFVTFKRWTKALGNITMIFIVLTDENPSAAAKRFLSRTGFILIPLSILLIKYYPEVGRGYDRWTGEMRYYGAVGDKNGLGYDCLIFGLGAVWSLIATFRNKTHRFRQWIAHGTILAMVFWLLHLAHSVTSMASFALGASIMLAVSLVGKGKAWRVHLIAGTITCAGIFVFAVPGVYAFLIELLGRNTSLTGRTDLWDDLLAMHSNPLFGTGFESFFLGDRLTFLWNKYWWQPQEAHDGYLETYLTLGWVGLTLLAVLILTGYRNAMASYRRDPHLGALRLAGLFVAIAYNGTESALKVMHPVLILFLLSVVAVPKAPVPAEELDLAADNLFGPKLQTAGGPQLARNRTAPAALVSGAGSPQAGAPRPNGRNQWNTPAAASAKRVRGSRDF
jgi:exopolysaccharide production protein ExoQ